MSRQNKVNPGQYTQAGRLSPDDAAREQSKTRASSASERSGSGQKAVPAGSRGRTAAAKRVVSPDSDTAAARPPRRPAVPARATARRPPRGR
jgi:hypothetical protein